MRVDKRRSSRINCRVRSEFTVINRRYKGYIENFSREGILKSIYTNIRDLYITSGTGLVIRFHTPYGEKIELECQVRWVRKHPDLPFGIRHYLGMEIHNPPQKYRDFMQELYYIYYASVLNLQTRSYTHNYFLEIENTDHPDGSHGFSF